MKCIIYISKATANKNGASIPAELSKIFRYARKKNASRNITGLLSYREGHYIQVLEGDTQAVDELFSTVRSDNRHTDIKVILNTPTSQRFFSNWSMRLTGSVARVPEFHLLAEQLLLGKGFLNEQQKQLFNIFYTKKSTLSDFSGSYHGKSLSLITWPDFTIIKQTPIIIELCARLINSPHHYDELVNSGDFGTQQQLNKLLYSLDKLHILKSAEQPKTKVIPVSTTEKSGNFYSKLKNFLGLKQRGL